MSRKIPCDGQKGWTVLGQRLSSSKDLASTMLYFLALKKVLAYVCRNVSEQEADMDQVVQNKI